MSTDTERLAEHEVGAHDRELPESLRRLACLSLSHERAPNERVGAVAPDDPGGLARELKGHERVTECVVLSTCNRVEVYASTRTADREDVGAALSVAYRALGEPDGVREYVGLDAVEHLARVACGLESAVLGEDQILGQVSRAFEEAREAGLAEGALSRVAEAAVRVGRKARDETGINDGEAGYGGAICRHIEGGLDRPPERVLIVGAGEMARIAATAIGRRWDARIDVANRSEERGLTSDDGTYWPLSTLPEALSRTEAVVTATGAPEPVISAEHAERCEADTPVVDLANPPDVSAKARDGLDVTDLDDLAADVGAKARSRRGAVAEVEELIEGAIERLVAGERENRAEDTLRALHREAARVRKRELERARARLADGEDDPEDVLEEFASALTGRLLADPTEALRAAARNGETETIAAAHRLFDLDGGGGEP